MDGLKGGPQSDGSLIVACVDCVTCARARVVAGWYENGETVSPAEPDPQCPCGETLATLKSVTRVAPTAEGRADEPLGNTSTDVGMLVACARCSARRVRAYEEERCPNCGEMKVISQDEAIRRTNQGQGNLLAAKGEVVAPCPNCGRPKPEKAQCAYCRKTSG